MKGTPGTPTHPLSNDDYKLLITPSNATNSATRSLGTISVIQTEAGQRELNNTASWDGIPNGRFGDYRSPAFGGLSYFGVAKNSFTSTSALP
jgi:methylenetetrahydrofolate reductase (NADPH)